MKGDFERLDPDGLFIDLFEMKDPAFWPTDVNLRLAFAHRKVNELNEIDQTYELN